ncbi:MAG TPA: ATP-binding protein [Kofleriaceae bacterium]|nr:ATP-binding protein [Kofleriaceae bacterium]
MRTSVRILVVDDDDHVREALVEELSTSYVVEAVASSSDALDMLAVDRYDVVISDLKMPEHDGIEVLEFARAHQGDAVRVLLTGYLDETAREALMTPDAPFKVGKPWHDEIDVVVRRGLEQRDLARRLSASVEDALRLSTLDGELDAAKSPLELMDIVVRRALGVEGVEACGTATRVAGDEHVLVGNTVAQLGRGWLLDLPLDGDGELRLRARGVGDSARQLVTYMANRAQRRCGVLQPAQLTMHSLDTPNTRHNQLMRQATIGAMTSSLLHDMASIMQSLSGALAEVCDSAEGDAAAAAHEANQAGAAAIELFVTMRKFIRDGEVKLKPTPLRKIVDAALRMCASYVRSRAALVIGDIPEGSVMAAESLLLQVITNVLRNAANASPSGGRIDLAAHLDGGDVVLTVTDDGPGVSPAIADQMFEPFATNTPDGTGLGLAIAAYVMQQHCGHINYRKHPTRGASFQIRLPRHA